MVKDKVLLRRKDGSGAGYLFNSKDAKRFMADKANAASYVEESPEETEANQRAADEAVKAQEADEDKAVRRAENKAR